MSPFQRIDVAMLWVARVFAAGFLFVTLYIFVMVCRHLDSSQFSSSSDYRAFMGGYVALLIIALLWVICTWCLRLDIARLYLGLSSILVWPLYGFLLLEASFYHGPIEVIIFLQVSFLGLFSLVWTAFHSRRSSPVRPDVLPGNKPLPSSGRGFLKFFTILLHLKTA